MKFAPLLLAALLIAPVVFSEVYMKPEDIRFRAGGVERLNPYAYDPRVQTFKQNVWVYLEPPQPPIWATGQPAIYPRATLRLQSIKSPYMPSGSAMLQTKDLRPSSFDNTWYQLWLYDTESDYYLNLGLFDAMEGGVGTLEFQSNHYFDPYDMVVITREKRDDNDPRPSTDIALLGRIVWQEYYVPAVLKQKEEMGYNYERQ
jgi:hypothetical protein